MNKIRSVSLINVLYSIIKKNLKLILRSKSSALIVILGPLLISILVGTAFNTSNLYGIKVGVYSSQYSDLSESILQEISNKQFIVTKIDSQDSCINSLKNGEIHVCAILPSNLEAGSTENMIFYVDHSRVNLVYAIIDAISQGVSSKSEQVSLDLTKIILDVLDRTNNEIGSKGDVLNNLVSNNQVVSEQISKTVKELNKIDISGVSIDFKAIEDKVDEIASANNLSTSVFNPVKELIEVAKNQTSVANSKLTNVSTIRELAISDLADTQGSISKNVESINSVKESIEKIRSDISNVKITNAEKIVRPINMQIESIQTNKTYLNYLFPTLVVLMILFVSVLLSSTIVIREKLSSAYFRNFITPVSGLWFVIGNYLTSIILVSLQLLILFGVVVYFVKGNLSILSLIVMLLVMASVFIFLGMIIGYLFKSEETVTLGAISISSLLLLFSNTVLPIEVLNKIKDIALYNPFVLAESSLKKIMLFGSSLNSVQTTIFILLGYLVCFFIIVLFLQRFTKK
jgi:ABC-2 type transport system permease protein